MLGKLETERGRLTPELPDLSAPAQPTVHMKL